MYIIYIYIAQQPDTYGADFSHFIGSTVVVVDLLDVPLIVDGLDRTYAHLLLVVVVVALLLADEQLVTVTRKVRRRLDDLFRGNCSCSRGGGCSFSRRSLSRELVLLRQRSLLGFLSTHIEYMDLLLRFCF